MLLFVPAERVAPVGTPEITTDTVSDVSVADVEIDSAIAVSSEPVAAETVRFGASATAFTVTARVWLVEAETLPSVEIDVTVSVKSASLLAGGVIVRPLSCAGVSVQEPLLLFVPAENVAPSGTPEITTETLSDESVADVEIERPIAVSSEPVAADTVRFGASATALTVTASAWLVEAETLPSVEIDVTVSVKSASLLAGGVIVKPLN